MALTVPKSELRQSRMRSAENEHTLPVNWSKTSGPYELIISLKRAFVAGGGLSHLVHVEVEVDGDVVFVTKDQQSPPIWNETCSIYFQDLHPKVPTKITVSAFKKRWTSPGYKLVGASGFVLSDFEPMLNEGEDERDVPLVPSKRNVTLHGNLIVGFELQNGNTPVDEAQPPTEASAELQSQSTDGDTPGPLKRGISKKKSTKLNPSSIRQHAEREKKVSYFRVVTELVDDAQDWWSHLDERFGSLAGISLVDVIFAALVIALAISTYKVWMGLHRDLHALSDKLSLIESSLKKISL